MATPLAGRYANAFSPQTPQQWLEERSKLLRQGYPREDVAEAMSKFAPPVNQNPGEQEVFKTIAETVKQRQWLDSPEGMKYQLELAREDAREKAKQGLMWGTLAKLPEQIANAISPFGGPVGAAMAYQGMLGIPGVFNQTLANYPQIQVPGYSSQQYRYFS